MTTWFIVTLFIFGALKVLVSSMPTSVVESIISRFELHQKLDEENTSISIDGRKKGIKRLDFLYTAMRNTLT